MATFVYEAMNQGGDQVKDDIEAASSEDALAKIRNLGYFPTRIREKGGARAKMAASGKKKRGAGFSFGSTQMSPYQRMHICGTKGRIEVEIPFNAPPDKPCRIFVDDGSWIHMDSRRSRGCRVK